MDVSAIVLAGGRSSRFGRTSSPSLIGGETVLERTVDAVRRSPSDIVVVAAASTDARRCRPASAWRIDAEADGGPLVGVVAGLEVAPCTTRPRRRWRHAVAGPRGPAALLDALEPRARGGGARGRWTRQQLPFAVRREPALAAARVLTAAGGRRLGALVGGAGSALVPEADWRASTRRRHAPGHRRARATCRRLRLSRRAPGPRTPRPRPRTCRRSASRRSRRPRGRTGPGRRPRGRPPCRPRWSPCRGPGGSRRRSPS